MSVCFSAPKIIPEKKEKQAKASYRKRKKERSKEIDGKKLFNEKRNHFTSIVAVRVHHHMEYLLRRKTNHSPKLLTYFFLCFIEH